LPYGLADGHDGLEKKLSIFKKTSRVCT